MKVLFYIREDYLCNMAGDTIQFQKTLEYLTKLGVEIKVSHNPYENLSSYDLIHLFNTIRVTDTYRFFMNTVKYKKKSVLTPIYWNYLQHIPHQDRNEMEKIYWNEGNRQRKEIFSGVDYILPSSETEMRQIELNFNIHKPYTVIPNGVDYQFIEGDGEDFKEKYDIDDFVLCVGRVCKHKNQLKLAQITNRLKIPFVIVGPVNHLKYYYECLSANPNLVYLSKIEHHQLANIYHGAKVHALVSWYEIPGLVTLEAGLACCNILTTKEGSTKEYFKDFVTYADPHQSQEIEERLLELMKTEKTTIFRDYVIKNYLWPDVVAGILKVYLDIIKA